MLQHPADQPQTGSTRPAAGKRLTVFLCIAAVIAIALWVKRRYLRKQEYLEACAILEKKELAPLEPMLPFTGLFSLKNPLQRSTFYMALTVFLNRKR